MWLSMFVVAPRMSGFLNARSTWFNHSAPLDEAQPIRGDASSGADEEDDSCLPDLDWTMRIQGFIMFMVLGFIASSLAWFTLSTGHYTKYATLMTLGNLMSICSTLLLMGPRRQCRKMFDETRQVATTVYLCTMTLTVVVAFTLQSVALCALCSAAQYLALIWYSLSYIPYGREMATGCLKNCGRVLVSV